MVGYPARLRRIPLNHLDVGGLLTFSVFPNLKGDALVIFEGTEAGSLDFGVVHEDVAGAVLLLNEAVAFFGVEELDGTVCYDELSFAEIK